MSEWSKVDDLKSSDVKASVGSNPTPAANFKEKKMKILACIKRFFAKLFGKKGAKELGSTEQTHWVNHIHDETVSVGGNWGTAQWANLHGFDEGPGATYWVGLDCRCWGIRMADYVVKCKNKATYDKYIDIAVHKGASDFLQAVLHDDALNVRRGGDVGIEFIFRWGGEDKSFDVRLAGDAFGEEK